MTRTRVLKDGEGWSVKSGEVFRLVCCDCGLTHNVVLVAEESELPSIGVALTRNSVSTSMRRKKLRQDKFTLPSGEYMEGR